MSFSSLGMAKLGTAELDTMLLLMLLLTEGATVVLLPLMLPRIMEPVLRERERERKDNKM